MHWANYAWHTQYLTPMVNWPALFAKLGAELAGCELPPPLRRAAWRHALLTPAEVKRCSDVLRASDEYGDARAAAAAAVAEGRLAAALPTLPAQMIARGLARAPPAERPRLERLATALIHRAYLCNGAQLPAPLGAHALAVVAATLPPGARAVGAEEVAALLRLTERAVPEGLAAARGAGADGLFARMEALLPRLLPQLLELAAAGARGRVGVGPRALLLETLEAEWLRCAFVGVLPWEAALWAIDQCVVHRRGWALLSDVAVACLWLLRRPLRRIAKAKRGLDELRDLLRDGLRDAPLHELQALLAGLDARVAPAASGAAGAAPVMRVAVPIAR